MVNLFKEFNIKSTKEDDVDVEPINLLKNMPQKTDDMTQKTDGRRSFREIYKQSLIDPTSPLKLAVGTGQELSEFINEKIPQLFGREGLKSPKIVETGLPEKLGAGALEWSLGGGALGSLGRLPGIKGGLEALSKIPKVGRALTSAPAQRIAGGGLLGAIEYPEDKPYGATIGAVTSGAFELLPAALNMMTKNSWSPFHSMMMPHIRNYLESSLRKVVRPVSYFIPGKDVEGQFFNKLSRGLLFGAELSGRQYNEAERLFNSVPKEEIEKVIGQDKINNIFDPQIKELGRFKDSQSRRDVKLLNDLKERVYNPVDFKEYSRKLKDQAKNQSNFNLMEAVDKINKEYDSFIEQVSDKEKIAPTLNSALKSYKLGNEYHAEYVVPFREREFTAKELAGEDIRGSFEDELPEKTKEFIYNKLPEDERSISLPEAIEKGLSNKEAKKILEEDINTDMLPVETARYIKEGTYSDKSKEILKSLMSKKDKIKLSNGDAKEIIRTGLKKKDLKNKNTLFYKAYKAGKSEGLIKNYVSNLNELKHLEKISPDSIPILTYGYFEKSMNNPKEFIEKFSSLGNDQRKILFRNNKDVLKNLEKLEKLYERHPNAFSKASAGAVFSRAAPAIAALISPLIPSGYGTALGIAGGGGLGVLGLSKLLSMTPSVRRRYIEGAKDVVPGLSGLLTSPAIRASSISGMNKFINDTGE